MTRTMLGGRLRHLKLDDPLPTYPGWGFYTSFGNQPHGRYTLREGEVYCVQQVAPVFLDPRFAVDNPTLSLLRTYPGSYLLYRWRTPYAGEATRTIVDPSRQLRSWIHDKPRTTDWATHWVFVTRWDLETEPKRSLPKLLARLEADWDETIAEATRTLVARVL